MTMPNDRRLQLALEYIEQNITQDISLYDIAQAAGFSVPHFYRLFKQLTGDTVGAYLLRCRIVMAARDLRENQDSVACIAFTYGFKSHDVFTRAFKRVYGVSPASYRRGNNPPPLKQIMAIEPGSMAGQDCMRFSLLHVNDFYVVGMECAARQWDQNGAIGRLWSDFLPHIHEIRQVEFPRVMYGICEHETCHAGEFTYLAALGVNREIDPPRGMTIRRMNAQAYFQADVPDRISVPDAYTSAAGYAKSLGYELAVTDEVEVYEETFRDPSIHRFKLWVPLNLPYGVHDEQRNCSLLQPARRDHQP
jgi:AraC family transcriptional regulator